MKKGHYTVTEENTYFNGRKQVSSGFRIPHLTPEQLKLFKRHVKKYIKVLDNYKIISKL